MNITAESGVEKTESKDFQCGCGVGVMRYGAVFFEVRPSAAHPDVVFEVSVPGWECDNPKCGQKAAKDDGPIYLAIAQFIRESEQNRLKGDPGSE